MDIRELIQDFVQVINLQVLRLSQKSTLKINKPLVKNRDLNKGSLVATLSK